MNGIKQQLYKNCQDYLQKRIATVKGAIEAAQQSANNETKSSSGDKYETGRAMMQLEIEKNAAQLQDAIKLKYQLDHINIETKTGFVQPGSLVVTNREAFFIAISVGKVSFGGVSYLVISPASPLGEKLMGLKEGDKMTFRDQKYTIQEIL